MDSYIRVDIGDYTNEDFKQVKLITNKGSELIINNFKMTYEPLNHVCDEMMEFIDNNISECLKPLFREEKEQEIIFSDIFNNLSEYIITLSKDVTNEFNKDGEYYEQLYKSKK